MINTITTTKDIILDIGLTAAGILFVGVDATIESLKNIDIIPNWLTILVVLSVVFLNVSRGISVLRNKNQKSKKDK